MLASVKFFWKRMGKMKLPYFFAYLLSTAAVILHLQVTELTGKMIDMFLSENSPHRPTEEPEYFILWLVSIVGIVFLVNLFNYCKVVLLEHSSQNILFNVRNELYDKLQNLDSHFYTKNTTGDMMSRVTGDIDLVRHIFAWVIYQSYEAILMFVYAFVILFQKNAVLTLIMLAFTPVILFYNKRIAKALHPQHAENREQATVLSTMAKENITGNRLVKAFVREKYEKERMTKENKKMSECYKKTHKIWAKNSTPINFFCTLYSIIGLFGGAILCITTPESFTLGDLTVFTGLAWALNQPLIMSGTLTNDIQRYSPSAEKIISLLTVNSRIKEKPNAIKLEEKIETIEFKNVSLKIDGSYILKNINLTLKRGESVGIMGPTGCGKSMLVGMLARFYDPVEGEILINGTNIKEFELNSLRKKFGYSHQDVFLFSNSIEGNIAYSDPDMPSERVYDSAKIADAHTFITRETINGYDTVIGERGIGLSGGQKQRIALARALATNAEVIILDDTTSAVDMETEKEIQEGLETLNDVMKIIIAQRITSVYKCDKIIIMDRAEISEMGTHKELKDTGGYYSRVFKIQHGMQKGG